MKKAILFISFTLISANLVAQESIQADRPGFGFSSSITPKGMFGLEGGATISEFGTNIGELFVRYGLMNNFEVQFEAGSIFFADGRNSEFSDQFVLLKYNFYSNSDKSLKLSLLNRTLIPLPFSGEGFEDIPIQFFLLSDIAISNEFAVNTNIGYGNIIFSDFNIDNYFFTINPSYQISPNTSSYLGFAYVENEFFDFKNYEIGVAHLINSDTQIDLGLVIDEESDVYLQIGIATRF